MGDIRFVNSVVDKKEQWVGGVERISAKSIITPIHYLVKKGRQAIVSKENGNSKVIYFWHYADSRRQTVAYV